MKRRPILFLIMILLALAMACNLTGGDDESKNSKSETPVEANSASEVADEPAQGATAATQDLESEPEPVSEESEALSTPTLAPPPTEEPAPEPTAASSEGQGSGRSGDAGSTGGDSGTSDGGDGSSGGGGAVASGDGWGESGSGPQSACDYPYFPMRTGSIWTYSNGPDTLIWEILDVQGDLDNATAVMRSTSGATVIEYEWTCSSSDGMGSFDFATFGIDELGTEMTISDLTMEGIFLPPVGDLQTGASWNLVINGSLFFTQDAGGQTVEVSGSLTSEQIFTVLSTDPVTFEDKTVDGVQIDEANTIYLVMEVLGNSISQDIALGSVFSMGRGIGLVRQDYTSDFGSETQELISYHIP